MNENIRNKSSNEAKVENILAVENKLGGTSTVPPVSEEDRMKKVLEKEATMESIKEVIKKRLN